MESNAPGSSQDVIFPAPTNAPSILGRVHSRMRGRYALAVLVGLVFAVMGVGAGYKNGTAVYRSSGILRITPLTLKILYAQHDIAPSLFDSFVDVQTSIIRSRPVIDAVLQNPEWLEATGNTAMTSEAFLRNLEVTHVARAELVTVSYSDLSPQTARLGVHLVIQEYLRIYGDRSGNQRILATQDRSTQIGNKLLKLQDEMARIATKYGTDDLKQLQLTKAQELARLEILVKDTEINLILAESSGGIVKDFDTMSIAEMAATDDLMRRFLEEKHKYESELQAVAGRLGAKHLDVINLTERLAAVEKTIKERADAVRKLRRTNTGNVGGGVEGVPAGTGLDGLKQRATKLRELYNSSLDTLLEIGRHSLQAVRINEEMRVAKERLAENQGRLEQLRVDSSVVGQINVISEPNLSPIPYKDRRKMFAIAGAVAGFLLGMALVLACAWMDRRVRRAEDVACFNADVPVLATIPLLPDGHRENVLAAYEVHRVLTAWQTDPQMTAARVMAITSVSSNDGKTELTIAIGVAVAAVGQRVLLIDFDPAGRRLTEWATGIAQLPLAPHQLEALPPTPIPGVHDLLTRRRSIANCVVRTTIPGLAILPTGAFGSGQRRGLTVSGIEQVLREAAAEFDVVLIDAGAVSETLDASLVCRGAESTLVVVPQHASGPEVRAAIDALRATGTAVGGVIFNRATTTSGKAQGIALQMFANLDLNRVAALPPELGPVVHAVLAVCPTLDPGTPDSDIGNGPIKESLLTTETIGDFCLDPGAGG